MENGLLIKNNEINFFTLNKKIFYDCIFFVKCMVSHHHYIYVSFVRNFNFSVFFSTKTMLSFEPKTLLKFLTDYNCCSISELRKVLTNYEWSNWHLVNNLIIRTNYLGPLKNFTIHGDVHITQNNSWDLRAYNNNNNNNNSGLSVCMYYYLNLGITLKHPELPCLAVKGSENDQNLFPLELLEAEVFYFYKKIFLKFHFSSSDE